MTAKVSTTILVEGEEDISQALLGAEPGTRLRLVLNKPFFSNKLLFLPIFDCLQWQKITDTIFIVTLSLPFFQTHIIALFTREMSSRLASIEQLAD